MPEALDQLFGGSLLAEGTSPPILAVRLAAALLLGWLAAAVYRRTNAAGAAPSFLATLVLLTILIAAVTQVIGNNVARAFSLVGALSIVRFRTVVQDTRDTAFVIFAVTLGMAAGAGDFWVALMTLVITGLAALFLGGRKVQATPESQYLLTVCLGLGVDLETALGPVLARHVRERRLTAVGTANRGASMESVLEVSLAAGSSPGALVDEINAIEGVLAVQIRAKEQPGF